MMMQIEVNGETTEVSEDATISVLLTQLSVTAQRLAVEVNEDIVPRSQHTAFQLSAGDRVEIVHAIGGG
jgi:sulfur carrier protein